ncbi:hypothetical protein ISS07_00025 [Candidatus Woesearchaeota archaeon]|nr:hypothetical protein [Candidatus Woesearchaeota archaeon]
MKKMILFLVFVMFISSVNALEPSDEVNCCFDAEDETGEVNEVYLEEYCPELDLDREKCNVEFEGWQKALDEFTNSGTDLGTCYDKDGINYDCDDPSRCYDDNGMVISCPKEASEIITTILYVAAGLIIIWSAYKFIGIGRVVFKKKK